MDVRHLEGKAALVTGAGSGIGRETALEIARRGGRLFLCDIDGTGLEETAQQARELGVHVRTGTLDVARAEEMAAFAEEVHGEVEAVDLLVNNAGVALGARFQDTTLEDWSWILGINLLGVVHGCHFFVPAMVARGRGGHVVNLASAAGYFPSDILSAYSATKSAVIGLSAALRIELAPEGIGVSAICPGIINTSIVRSSRLRGEQATDGARELMADLYARRSYGPERVARSILRAVQRNRAVAPVSPEAWVFYYLARWTPALARGLSALRSRLLRRRLEARSG